MEKQETDELKQIEIKKEAEDFVNLILDIINTEDNIK